MESKGREQNDVACPYCTTYKHYKNFQKILDTKDAGLVVYRHSVMEDINKISGSKKTDHKKDVFILHNTKNMKIISTDIISTLVQNKINCQRCRYIMKHVQLLLENVQTLDENDILSLCEDCRLKGRSQSIFCNICREIVKKYKAEVLENKKKLVNIWLNKFQRVLEDALVDDKGTKTKIQSDSDIRKFMSESEFRQLLLDKRNTFSLTKVQEQDKRITYLVSSTDNQKALNSIDQLQSNNQLLYNTNENYCKKNLENSYEKTSTNTKRPSLIKHSKKEMIFLQPHVSQEMHISKDFLRNDFSIIFPKEINVNNSNAKRHETSSELIKHMLEGRRKEKQIKLEDNKKLVKEETNIIEERSKKKYIKLDITEEKHIQRIDKSRLKKSKVDQNDEINTTKNIFKSTMNNFVHVDDNVIHKERKRQIKDEQMKSKRTEIKNNKLISEKKKTIVKQQIKYNKIEPEITEEKNGHFKKETKKYKLEKNGKNVVQEETKKSINIQTNNIDYGRQSIIDNINQYQPIIDQAKVTRDKSQEKKVTTQRENYVKDEELIQETYINKSNDKNEKISEKNKKLKSITSVNNQKEHQEELKKIDRDTDKINNNIQYFEENKDFKQKNIGKEKLKKGNDQNVLKDKNGIINIPNSKDREPKNDEMKRNVEAQKVKDDMKAKFNSSQIKDKSPDDVKLKAKTLTKLHISALVNKQQKIGTHEKKDYVNLCSDSDMKLDTNTRKDKAEIIVGQKILKYKSSHVAKNENDRIPLLFKTTFKELVLKQKSNIHISEETPPLTHTLILATKGEKADQDIAKGVIRYALSDRTFIEKGWTMLPTEKVVRKMNVYRMRLAHPEFDWFEQNKNKGIMLYDTGERLAEFDDSGRGRWFYRNGRLALDYYDAEEINAQRFVVYSSGELDERGHSHPVTILAAFDYLGNGIVFDHAGKIRLKYNQTEGVVLDRNIGPFSHWKWHTLNDPPVLQQVIIDTQMAHKDSEILKLSGPSDDKSRKDNDEMLAIEYDNFIKEKNKKLSQKFKPYQIKMKALKINEYFSLRILDQATIYLLYRDGSINLKLNIGMVLDHQEIVDTDTAEVGEVSNNLERLPARTDSVAGLQQIIGYAQRLESSRVERERRLRRPTICASVDQLTAGISQPLKPPFRTIPSATFY